MKKILVVGATYSNNFGDMLFARMIADALYKQNKIRFYLLSDFAKEFVGAEKLSDFDLRDADALVYMPGGFFGDRHVTSLIVTWQWFKRFFPPGIRFALKHKSMLVLGVGAGPCKYTIMKKIIKFICRHSKKIIVRESDSYDFLKSIGVESKVTSDLAQLITEYPLPEINTDFGEKKKLLVHVNQNPRVISKILPAVKSFYEKHRNEYSLVIASDQVCPNDCKTYEQFRAFAGDDAKFYKYGDPLELCNVINQCDCVITYKLHMGIVACSYGKSVIAIPEHYKKVERYYKQIGYSERVLPFHRADSDSIFSLIESYHNSPVNIPDDVIAAARENFCELKNFIEEL